MDAQSLGPLFVPPWEAHGAGWMSWIPIALAAAAAAIAVVGLVRGRLAPPVGALGLVVLPLASYGFGVLLLLEDSKRTEFCGSCHVMGPLVESLEANDGSLASSHFAKGAVPAREACYVCHSGYGIWGTLDAKKAGVGHMIRTVTGRYELPLALAGTFDIQACLGCHAATASFRDAEEHRPLDVQEALLAGELGCTGDCHDVAHPESALMGAPPERAAP